MAKQGAKGQGTPGRSLFGFGKPEVSPRAPMSESERAMPYIKARRCAARMLWARVGIMGARPAAQLAWVCYILGASFGLDPVRLYNAAQRRGLVAAQVGPLWQDEDALRALCADDQVSG